MIKPITDKEIENIEKMLKIKKWSYSFFIIMTCIWIIAGTVKLYAINQVCKKVSGLTWSLILETSFSPKTKTSYYGGVVQISHWLYGAIAYYGVACYFIFLLFIMIQQNRRGYLLLELYNKDKSNKKNSLNPPLSGK
jgi:hypothetical protein